MYLAIDLGSTNFKAVLFDEKLNRLGVGSHELNYLCRGQKTEMSVKEAESALKSAIKEALSSAGIPGEKIEAIGVTSQAQTFTIQDESGSYKIPFISWMDSRAANLASALSVDSEFANFADHCSFSQPSSGIMMCIIKALLNENPALISSNDRILPIASWLTKQISDTYAIDDNLAAMQGFYSWSEGRRWEKMIEFCNLKENQVPEVFPVGSAVAKSTEKAERFGLPKGIPIYLTGNDQTGGAYGAKVHDGDKILITLGSAQIAYTKVKSRSKPESGIAQGPYPGGDFYRMGVDSYGGCLISMVIEQMPEFDSYQSFFDLAEKALNTPNEIKMLVDEARNAISWEGESSNLGHYALACIEFLVDRMVDLVGKLGKNIAETEILCAGGGAKAALWVKMLEEKLDSKLIPTEADPLLGAARMLIEKQ